VVSFIFTNLLNKLARILYITPFFNYPPRDGASLRTVHLFEKLNEKHDVHLLTYYNEGLDNYKNQIYKKKKIHYFNSFFTVNKKMTFIQRFFSSSLPGFASHNIKSISNDIEQVALKLGHFDIYYFATQLMGQVILNNRKISGIYVIDLYDLYIKHREGKILEAPFWRPFHWLFRLEALRVRKYEKKILQKFDHILVTSKEEIQIIDKLVPNSVVHEVPNGIDYPDKIQRKNIVGDILMVGNFYHGPNAEGILWFYNEVWAKVKNGFPNSKLILVGEMPQALKTVFLNDKDIDIAGLVSNLDFYYEKAGCVIIPIFNLSGIKLKLLEAIAYGIPIVSTTDGTIGIENINTIEVANSPINFAQAIIKFLKSNNLNEEEIEKGRNLIKKKYTWDKIGDGLNNIIDSLDENICDTASS